MGLILFKMQHTTFSATITMTSYPISILSNKNSSNLLFLIHVVLNNIRRMSIFVI